MDKKLKAKWLRALRSGKYLQVRGTLQGVRLDGKIGNCCLGVLCKVAKVGRFSESVVGPMSRNEARLLARQNRGRFYLITAQGREYSGVVPPEFGEATGLDRLIGHNTVQGLLSDMNDTRRMSFRRIANWIEKFL